MKSKAKKASTTKQINTPNIVDSKDESIEKTLDPIEAATDLEKQPELAKLKETKSKKRETKNIKKEKSPPPVSPSEEESEEPNTEALVAEKDHAKSSQIDLVNQRKPKAKKSKTVKLGKQALLDLKHEMEEREVRRANNVKPEVFFTKKKIFIVVFLAFLFLVRLFKVFFK
jgi:hypothetical protein